MIGVVELSARTSVSERAIATMYWCHIDAIANINVPTVTLVQQCIGAPIYRRSHWCHDIFPALKNRYFGLPTSANMPLGARQFRQGHIFPL